MKNSWIWIALTALLILVTMTGMLAFVSFSYATENNSRTPVVATTFISYLSYASASVGGEVRYDQGSEVISRGMCWSSKPNPTLKDAVTTAGKGSGSYMSRITGLKPNTIYYFRAFATNISGVGYGEVISLKTFNDPQVR